MPISLNANALTTLEMAKVYLKIPTLETSLDELVKFWINAASDMIESECERGLKAKSITEIQHGRRQNILLLREYPVNSITELRIDGNGIFTDAATLIPSSDYAITDDKNGVLYKHATFNMGYNNVRVIYNGGFSVIPSDLEDACLWTVFWKKSIRDAADIGRTNKNKEGESISYSQSVPDDVKNTILRYKRTEFPGSNSMMFNV